MAVFYSEDGEEDENGEDGEEDRSQRGTKVGAGDIWGRGIHVGGAIPPFGGMSVRPLWPSVQVVFASAIHSPLSWQSSPSAMKRPGHPSQLPAFPTRHLKSSSLAAVCPT